MDLTIKDRMILEIRMQQYSSHYPGLSELMLIALVGMSPQPAVSVAARNSDLSSALTTSSTRLPFRAKVPSGTGKAYLFYSIKRYFTELIRSKELSISLAGNVSYSENW